MQSHVTWIPWIPWTTCFESSHLPRSGRMLPARWEEKIASTKVSLLQSNCAGEPSFSHVLSCSLTHFFSKSNFVLFRSFCLVQCCLSVLVSYLGNFRFTLEHNMKPCFKPAALLTWPAKKQLQTTPAEAMCCQISMRRAPRISGTQWRTQISGVASQLSTLAQRQDEVDEVDVVKVFWTQNERIQKHKI